MTWQVSPEEWLLDFTTLPRGRVRAGESLDAIDDRLRQMLAGPPPAMIMPVLAARTKPPPAPPKVPEPPTLKVPEPPTLKVPEPPSLKVPEPPPVEASGAIIPVLEARPEPRPAPQPPPARVDSSTSRSISGEIGLVMPTLATRPPPVAPTPMTPPAPAPPPAPVSPPAPVAAREPSAPLATREPLAQPTPEPTEPERPTLDVQLVQTPVAPAGPAPVVIPTLTRGGFHIDVDDDEASALDRLNPVGDLGVPSDDADGEDFMSAVAAATPVMSTPTPADSLNEVHLDEVIDELDPEAILPEFSNPSISIAALTAQLPQQKAPEKPPAPVEKAQEKPPLSERTTLPPPPPIEKATIPPPPPPEKATIPPPPPPEKATIPPPPPIEKATDKPPPPRPPAPAKAPPAVVTTPPPGNQPPRKRGWYDDAFAEHYGNITPNDADAAAELDAAFIRKSAELGAGQSVLDVGCGDGRHCFALANLGLLVTGLEASLPQLVRAAQRNEATEAGITLLQGDMRSLPRDRQYDAVTCLGTSLGYFESEEQNKLCLQEMVEVLRPGGKLVLQMVNRDNLVAVLPCRSWWQGRGCLVLDVADMNYFTNRMRVHRTVVFEDGRQFEHQMFIRLFSLHELNRMLTGMGMRVLEVSGSRDTRGRFYGATSAEIWLIAQRRDDV